MGIHYEIVFPGVVLCIFGLVLLGLLGRVYEEKGSKTIHQEDSNFPTNNMSYSLIVFVFRLKTVGSGLSSCVAVAVHVGESAHSGLS